MKKSLGFCIITLVAGLVTVQSVLCLHGYDFAQGTQRIKILADAFTIPGVVITLLGILALLFRAGAVAGIAYLTAVAWQTLVPGRSVQEPMSFGDFVLQRRSRVDHTSIWVFFVVGGIHLAVAVWFTALFFAGI